MDQPRFDAGGFFEFDLSSGAVRTRGGARVLVMSDAVLAPLVAMAVRQGDLTALRRLGNQLGLEVRESIGAKAAQSSPELVASHSAAVVAIFGWGKLRLERWGDALVVLLESGPSLDGDRLAVAALLGGLFSAVAGREVACVPTSPDDRYLIVDPTIAEEVWSWSKAQQDVAEIVRRLSAGDAT